MSEKLKRRRPDIMVVGEGKAMAVMQEDPMGVWCHIQEVRDLLAKKDMEIFNLKEELSYIKEDSTFDRDKHEELLKSKDEEIRRLNHKYWDDKADEAAKMKRLIQNGEIIYLDEYCNEKDWRIMHKVWEDEETKCRAKAEEFKEEK